MGQATGLALAVNRHFQGDPKDQRDWWQYNMSFSNLSLTPERFLADIREGHGFCAQHRHRQLPQEQPDGSIKYTTYRVAANYIQTQVLGLDFDTEDERSAFDVLMNDPIIGQYAGILYTTKSHTPEKPRSRVVFFLPEPMADPKSYTAIARTLNWHYRVTDAVTVDPVRNWGGSRDCDYLLYPAKILDLKIIRPIYKQYAAYQKEHERVRRQGHYEGSREVDPDELKRALMAIPSGQGMLPYQDWVRVLAGLYTELGDQGIEIASQWTDAKQGELEAMWRSFSHGTRATGRTVLAVARQHGFISEQDRERRSRNVNRALRSRLRH
jgi:hypothetical protein